MSWLAGDRHFYTFTRVASGSVCAYPTFLFFFEDTLWRWGYWDREELWVQKLFSQSLGSHNMDHVFSISWHLFHPYPFQVQVSKRYFFHLPAGRPLYRGPSLYFISPHIPVLWKPKVVVVIIWFESLFLPFLGNCFYLYPFQRQVCESFLRYLFSVYFFFPPTKPSIRVCWPCWWSPVCCVVEVVQPGDRRGRESIALVVGVITAQIVMGLTRCLLVLFIIWPPNLSKDTCSWTRTLQAAGTAVCILFKWWWWWWW